MSLMGDVYLLADGDILRGIGEKIKSCRLKQDITQRSLAESSGVPLSTLKRIESGEVGALESLLRVMRVLGLLDTIQSLVDEE